ncbi:hypothetical protein T484DRAFT_3326684 [Baffinella frigidus]|nr:hypothetical protein T484DRAFT_3326684 [Cryptophyta sp. CCMP2293]
MYTNSSSDWTPNCTMCPVGTAKPAGTGDACTACPENAEAVTLGMGMCLCVAGYAGDPNTLEPPFCTECGFGFYNPGSANTPCSACPAGTNTTSSNASESVCDCDCLEGYVGAACGACAICEVPLNQSPPLATQFAPQIGRCVFVKFVKIIVFKNCDCECLEGYVEEAYNSTTLQVYN